MPQYIVDPCIRALGILRPGKPLLLIRVPLASIGNFGTLPLCIDPRCTIYRLHLKYMYRVQIVIKDVQIRMMLPAFINRWRILVRLDYVAMFFTGTFGGICCLIPAKIFFSHQSAQVFSMLNRGVNHLSSLSNGSS